MDEKSNDGAFDMIVDIQENTDDPMSMEEPRRQLPEKYKLLSEVFNSMLLSIRTLEYMNRSPLYHYITPLVEVNLGRPLTYRDLAQIKSILPEAVLTNKFLTLIKERDRFEPQLIVTLLFDAVPGHTEFSDIVALSVEFTSRLFKLVDTQSEDYEVPEAQLPEPFNTRQIRVSPKKNLVDSSKNERRNNARVRVRSHRPSCYGEHFAKIAKKYANSSSPVVGEEMSSTSAKDYQVAEAEVPSTTDQRGLLAKRISDISLIDDEEGQS